MADMIPDMSLVVTRGFGRSKINTIEAGPVTLGYGGIEILVPTRILEPAHIDSRPLLFPPEVFTGEIPVGVPRIDVPVTVYTPDVQTVDYLDIIYMTLGIRQVVSNNVGVGISMGGFTLGTAMDTSATLGIGQAFGANMGIGEELDQLFTQTLDY